MRRLEQYWRRFLVARTCPSRWRLRAPGRMQRKQKFLHPYHVVAAVVTCQGGWIVRGTHGSKRVTAASCTCAMGLVFFARSQCLMRVLIYELNTTREPRRRPLWYLKILLCLPTFWYQHGQPEQVAGISLRIGNELWQEALGEDHKS